MGGSQRCERIRERRIVLLSTDGDEKDGVGIETKRQSRRALLTCTCRSPRQKRFNRFDSLRSAGTGRLILPRGDRDGGSDSIDEKAGNNALFGAQRPQDQRQSGWEFSLDLELVRGRRRAGWGNRLLA